MEDSSKGVWDAGQSDMFAGEVALVTGAATGIGKACVEAFLRRGAAVVGLDIKAEIKAVSASPVYLGLVCDLTDEDAVRAALAAAVQAFGGLDMLVLNAGIFPPSVALDSLSLAHWRQVFAINLDSNVTLLRETYPLLKAAKRYGRVVINASRNVPAPGPGAAAYSASKAALTQLGRVAALEWAKVGIRVNMLHPHAVFDTGIWTDEVIQSRAAKYGLTVEQYKKNNLLGVELCSRDLGEMIAEMCGPLFKNTTGAQVPADGGSDRVI
jgi:NAD(P)-dependent dehydrogenase (short-subunit alcohol dehydrogenase family)